MGNYSIKFTLNQNPANATGIAIDCGGGVIFEFDFYDSPAPNGPNNVSIVSGSTSGTTSNLYGVFFQTYNRTGIYIQELNGNQLTIKGNFVSQPVISYNTANINVVVAPYTAPIQLISHSIQQNPVARFCDQVEVTINSSGNFVKILEPIVLNVLATSTYSFRDQLRGATIRYTVQDASGNTSSMNVTTPAYFNSGLIDVSVTNNTVYINSPVSDIIKEYSLTGTVWQTENFFSGLVAGDYTAYARDYYGCEATKPFTIQAGDDGVIKVVEPYFYYSKANAIVMALRENINGCDIMRNDNNSLSCESFDRVKYRELQKYKSCDVVNLQFKNNYADFKVVTTDDGLEVPLVQKSANMNNKTALDAILTKINDVNIGIHFTEGNTYNYDTLAIEGQYQLNGTLPAWLVEGAVITLNNFNYTVKGTVYNELLGVEQAVINATLSDGTYILKAIYNIFDYEIYEVAIPMLNRTRLQISLFFNGIEQYLSEVIVVDDTLEPLVKVQYYMKYNTDMFYATGIQPMFRAWLDMSTAIVQGTSEQYKTDTTVLQIDSQNYEVNEYKFMPVTKQMARKMVLAFLSSNININGINYVAQEAASIEKLDDSNLYVVSVKLIDSGSGIGRTYEGNIFVTLPKLITTEQGFIKI